MLENSHYHGINFDNFMGDYNHEPHQLVGKTAFRFRFRLPVDVTCADKNDVEDAPKHVVSNKKQVARLSQAGRAMLPVCL